MKTIWVFFSSKIRWYSMSNGHITLKCENYQMIIQKRELRIRVVESACTLRETIEVNSPRKRDINWALRRDLQRNLKFVQNIGYIKNLHVIHSKFHEQSYAKYRRSVNCKMNVFAACSPLIPITTEKNGYKSRNLPWHGIDRNVVIQWDGLFGCIAVPRYK